MKIFGKVILLGIVSFAILFLLQSLGLVNYKFFAPKYEEARREVWEQTPSYVEGIRQEVSKLQYEYTIASGVQKEALKKLILHKTSNIDLSLLDYELQQFVRSL